MQNFNKISVLGLVCIFIMCHAEKISLDECVEAASVKDIAQNNIPDKEKQFSQLYPEVVELHARIIRITHEKLDEIVQQQQVLLAEQRHSLEQVETLLHGKKIPRKQLLKEKKKLEQRVQTLSS